MQMRVEKLLKIISTKKQDTGYLWQGEQETCQGGTEEAPLSGSQFSSLVLGDGYTRARCELFLTVHRYLLTHALFLKVLFHDSKDRWNRTHVEGSGHLDSWSGYP